MNNYYIFEDAQRVIDKVDFSFLEGKTVLVTGATGLLGSHFLAALALLKERGMDIFINAYGHSELPNHMKEILSRGGVFVFPYLGDLLPADVIIHAAGFAQPARFTAAPVETIRINTSMTSNLLSRLNAGGKFLFVSSSEVYSGLGGLVTESSIGTTGPNHSRACYIEGKRCGEAIVNAYRAAGIDAKSARLSLAYGPGTRKHDQRAMMNFIEQALTTKHIDLKYSGREPRTFCYISDAVEMMFEVLLHGKQDVYNVGGESVTNMAGVAQEIAYQTESSLFIPTEETTMPGAPLVVRMDLSRYKAEFGEREFVGMAPGLERTINWQRGLYGL